MLTRNSTHDDRIGWYVFDETEKPYFDIASKVSKFFITLHETMVSDSNNMVGHGMLTLANIKKNFMIDFVNLMANFTSPESKNRELDKLVDQYLNDFQELFITRRNY